MQPSFQEFYSAKSDEELLGLAADNASLMKDAKTILWQELERHNLQQPLMRGVKTYSELNLGGGIFVIGAIFAASDFVALWLLVVTGWNPLSGGIYSYAGIAIPFIVGAQ